MNAASLCALLLAYLLGALPSAWLAGKWAKGIDIRQHGSGNMGATNVFRVLGPGPGVAVLLADIAKGALAVLLVPRLFPGYDGQAGAPWDVPTLSALWWPCVLGLAAVLGHSYTLFLGFKGGKGVATSLGVFLALAPLATLAAVAVFGGVFWVTRMVSAGSLAAAAFLPGAVALFNEWRPWTGRPEGFFESLSLAGQDGWRARPVLCLALVLSLLVWLKHLPNIRRILAGTESKILSGKGRGA
ncbi:MAG TPA: glycerol-3-phosphate 1-O-acyltransferase PlsY [bacterium]|jgi:glycerol-3-phosphate acyltransferase PlsY|nr:glycerol-3-phosphate 1-O-acyltransferase PlsY [bacterium]